MISAQTIRKCLPSDTLLTNKLTLLRVPKPPLPEKDLKKLCKDGYLLCNKEEKIDYTQSPSAILTFKRWFVTPKMWNIYVENNKLSPEGQKFWQRQIKEFYSFCHSKGYSSSWQPEDTFKNLLNEFIRHNHNMSISIHKLLQLLVFSNVVKLMYSEIGHTYKIRWVNHEQLKEYYIDHHAPRNSMLKINLEAERQYKQDREEAKRMREERLAKAKADFKPKLKTTIKL